LIYNQLEAQSTISKGKRADLVLIWDKPLVTQLLPFEVFYIAEDYYQEYFKMNPYQGYCQIVDAPKVAKFHQKFAARLKK